MPLIRMEHINKFFGRVQALNDVSLSVESNEIVGLLGDNGAGKSTLIKILSGAIRADSGKIYVNGHEVDVRTTRDAIAHGIETIYQDSALVPHRVGTKFLQSGSVFRDRSTRFDAPQCNLR